MARSISLAKARAQYPHRYTMEHVPAWSQRRPIDDGGSELGFYAPQYRSDAEWYGNTVFPGEGGIPKSADHCISQGQTWPLGQWLDKPYVAEG